MDKLKWIKSSRSDNSGPYCVEVAAAAGGQVAMRNSQRPELDHILVTREEWAAFLAGAKAGDFDNI